MLEEDVLNLEQVVVTGTRTSHFVKDVPVRTEVITAKAIENKNASNIYQALEGTPGIRVENQCQYCNFTMVRMQGLGAEHTQVLINGQPMYSGLAGVYGLQQMSTVDIDKIEVVKGAGSALYGSGAVAGAINIVTKSLVLSLLLQSDCNLATTKQTNMTSHPPYETTKETSASMFLHNATPKVPSTKQAGGSPKRKLKIRMAFLTG